MDSVNMNTGMGPQMFAMKNATDIQARDVFQMLEGMDLLKSVESAPDKPAAAQPVQQSAPVDSALGAELTGLGQKLDITV